MPARRRPPRSRVTGPTRDFLPRWRAPCAQASWLPSTCCASPGGRASSRGRSGLTMDLRAGCRSCRVQLQAELGKLLPRLARAHALDRAVDLGRAGDRGGKCLRRVTLRLLDDGLGWLVRVAAVGEDEKDIGNREEKVSGGLSFSPQAVEDANVARGVARDQGFGRCEGIEARDVRDRVAHHLQGELAFGGKQRELLQLLMRGEQVAFD